MEALTFSPEVIAPLVIAMGFAAGLNVYATVLSLGIMSRMGWVALPPGLEKLDDGWVLVASALLFAGEFIADKIPVMDVLWSALHTVVRIPVAALLGYAAASHLSPGMQVLATCLGAAFGAIAHSSKTAVRLAVTPSPEPFSNIALSTAEDGAAVGLSWMAMHHPLVAGSVALALTVVAAGVVWWCVRLIRAGWERIFRDRRREDVSADGPWQARMMRQ